MLHYQLSISEFVWLSICVDSGMGLRYLVPQEMYMTVTLCQRGQSGTETTCITILRSQ